jgi:hypothetical protein
MSSIDVMWDIKIVGSTAQNNHFRSELELQFPRVYSERPPTLHSIGLTVTNNTYTRKSIEHFVDDVTGWLLVWSRVYKGAVFNSYVERLPRRGTPGQINYGAVLDGVSLTRGVITGHNDLDTKFPEKPCHCHRAPYSYPDTAPYADCPARANPPTDWAVREFLTLSENLSYPTKRKVH